MRANRKHIWHQEIFEPVEFLTADMLDYRYPPHVHEVFSIQAVDDAPQQFRTKTGKETLPPKSLTVINPDEVHEGWCATGTRWRYRMLYPSPSLVGRCLGIGTEHAERLGFGAHVIDDPDLFDLFDRLHSAATDDDSLEQQELMIEFIQGLFARHAEHRPAENKQDSRVAGECMAYISDNYRESVTLETLAATVGASEAHVVRTFSRAFGISPLAYRNSLRVESAKKLLQDGLSIAKTATELGFYDQSHFHKAFRKIVGVTPGQFLQHF